MTEQWLLESMDALAFQNQKMALLGVKKVDFWPEKRLIFRPNFFKSIS